MSVIFNKVTIYLRLLNWLIDSFCKKANKFQNINCQFNCVLLFTNLLVKPMEIKQWQCQLFSDKNKHCYFFGSSPIISYFVG